MYCLPFRHVTREFKQRFDDDDDDDDDDDGDDGDDDDDDDDDDVLVFRSLSVAHFYQ